VSNQRRFVWLELAERIGRHAETALLTVLLTALIGIACTQILLRNVFATGLSWLDGGAQMLVLWIAVVGALAASRDGRHIAINLSARILPAQWNRWVTVVVDCFAMLVAGRFAWHAAGFVADSKAFGDELLGGVPAWTLQLILPVGFALIAWRFAIFALRGCIGSRAK